MNLPPEPQTSPAAAPLPTKARMRVSRYDVVRVLLAVLLLTAAALKGHQLATEPVANTSLLTSRWFLATVVEFELALGLWLLAGLYPQCTWRIALACFSAFASAALYKAISGEASCGCFGKVPVNPWYTFVLDAVAVFALLGSRPRGSILPVRTRVSSLRVRLAGVAVLALVLGVPLAVAMTDYRPAVVSDGGEILGSGEFVVLLPEDWIDKRFPLSEYVSIGDELMEGEWIVILYHHDCPKCQEVIPRYERCARQARGGLAARQVSLIEVPPYDFSATPSKSSCRCGRLSEAKEWFVAAPVELVLRNGVVIKVSKDLRELEAWEAELAIAAGESPLAFSAFFRRETPWLLEWETNEDRPRRPRVTLFQRPIRESVHLTEVLS